MTTTEVWETYANDVKRLIMSKVKDTQITNDLVQEVFIKVHKTHNSRRRTQSEIVVIKREQKYGFGLF
jgi:RNA polymerase sigma-70 factor (ECF subfamily)